MLEGEDATFKCVVSPEDVQLVWLMDNEAIAASDRFQASRNGLCHSLVIKKCLILDNSRITAEAEGTMSRASLKVQGEAGGKDGWGRAYLLCLVQDLTCLN